MAMTGYLILQRLIVRSAINSLPVMNISILGVMPWRELDAAAKSNTHLYFIATMMQRVYGHWAGVLAAVLIMWTAFASVFSLLFGYSRVPYAAALDGNYFPTFARVHVRHRIPHFSLLALGAVTLAFCFLRLADVIAALVVIRILLQFLVQTVGLIVFRIQQPEVERPFRVWLYPLPAVLSIVGFLYVVIERKGFLKEVRYAAVLLVLGLLIFLFRAWRHREWPLAGTGAQV